MKHRRPSTSNQTSARAAALAEREGYFEIAELLQAADRVDREELNDRLRRSIQRGGDLEVIRGLLRSGADTEAETSSGSRPIDTAMVFRRVEIVALLLDNGADPNGGNAGYSPLAENQYHASIAARLRAAGAKSRPNVLRSPLFTRAGPDRIRELIAHGADVNARNEWGRSVLNQAIENRDVEIVRILVANSATVNKESRIFQVPPILAVVTDSGYSEEHAEILKILLNNGADPDVQHFQRGETPLHFAAERERWTLVDLLLEAGASPDIPDRAGKTAREILTEKGRSLPDANSKTSAPAP